MDRVRRHVKDEARITSSWSHMKALFAQEFHRHTSSSVGLDPAKQDDAKDQLLALYLSSAKTLLRNNSPFSMMLFPLWLVFGQD